MGVERVFFFFFLNNGKEFLVCTVEIVGREVNKRKISWWKKGRIPVSGDIIREIHDPRGFWG